MALLLPTPRLWLEATVHWVRGNPGHCYCCLYPGATKTQGGWVCVYRCGCGYVCEYQLWMWSVIFLSPYFSLAVNECGFHGLLRLWEGETSTYNCKEYAWRDFVRWGSVVHCCTLLHMCPLLCILYCTLYCTLYCILYCTLILHTTCTLLECLVTLLMYSSAFEFMDSCSMEIVEKHLPHHNPISAYPFYVLVETSGSHESHDREVRVGGSEVWEVCVYVRHWLFSKSAVIRHF